MLYFLCYDGSLDGAEGLSAHRCYERAFTGEKGAGDLDHYTWEQVSEHGYLICEDYGPGTRYTIGLVAGSREAAILDSGWGLTGNLRRFAAGITDRPVSCFLTHPHPDHGGASVQFDRIYMNPVDGPIVQRCLSREKRLRDMRALFAGTGLFEEMEREITDCSGFSFTPVEDGEIFDLGGVSIRAAFLPGHTSGSTAYYCREDEIAFVGDAAGPQTLLLYGEANDGASDIRLYMEKLAAFRSSMGENTRVFAGHTQSPMHTDLLDTLIGICGNILAGRGNPQVAVLPAFLREKLGERRVWRASENGAAVFYTE